MSSAGIRTRLARGDWLLLGRSVYAVAAVRPTFEQAAQAACLAGGEACWASHGTAALLWGLGLPEDRGIEVLTLPSQRVRLAGVVQHRSLHLPRADLRRCRLVPATSVARTMVDCLPQLTGHRLPRVVDDALRRKVPDPRRAGRVCRPARPRREAAPSRPLRAVLADRLPGTTRGRTNGSWESSACSCGLASRCRSSRGGSPSADGSESWTSPTPRRGWGSSSTASPSTGGSGGR